MAAFQVADADWFFGRAELVRELTDRVAGRRFVGVFGPSGSGKSSVLRAGLVPALARPTQGRPAWPTVVFTPGAHPLTECATHLGELLRIPAGEVRADLVAQPQHLHMAVRQALLGRPDDVDLVLVVDQFDEVFTLVADPAERAAFITTLASAATTPGSRLRVVLGVGADFYGRCAEYRELVDALRGSQVLVGAMLPVELRAAITEPAGRAGLTVDATLVSTIISEMAGRPGALPLMSHALVETWRRRRGTTLTLAGYEACGGIDRAVEQTAETVYGTLTDTQQDLVLGLTAGPDTARRVRWTELGADPGVAEVVRILADAGLITVGTDSVEIPHETLIRSWPRLRDWLDQNRAETRLQLTDDTGLSERERELRLRRRRTRRLWTLVGCLVVTTCVAAVMSVVAVQQRADADAQRAQALSRELATRSGELINSDPIGARVLALAAWAEAPTAQARGAVLSLQTPKTHFNNGEQGQLFQATTNPRIVWSAAVSADGHTMALDLVDGSILVSDTASGRLIATVVAPGRGPGILATIALSPDGRQFVTNNHADPVQIWDTATGKPIMRLPVVPDDLGSGLAYSPDGHTLAVSAGTHIMLWDTVTWHRRATIDHADVSSYTQGDTHGGALAFTPDGRVVARALSDSITLWDTASGRRIASLAQPGGNLSAVAFGRDWHTVVAQTLSNTIVLWQPANGQTVVTMQENMATEPHMMTYDPTRQTVSGYATGGSISTWQTDFDTVFHQLCADTADGAILPDHWNQITTGIARPPMCKNG